MAERIRFSWTFLLLAALPLAAPSQQVPAPGSSPDYSEEAYIIETLLVRARFEGDGTGRREVHMRLRVNSEAGVQQLGQLVFDYSSASERPVIEFVRVYKADGSVVTAREETVQDLTAPVAREAPVYTDLRQKHVTVPALRPGETLEYRVVNVIHTPYAPGHFWLEHEFTEDGIVLEEILEVDTPRERAVKLKTREGFPPEVNEEGGRRIYRWRRARPVRPSEEEEKKKKRPAKRLLAPAVQLTTFQSWAELGRWYAELERSRAVVTPEVRARALELTRGLAGEDEKIRALYGFVARNFRYVSLSFGVGRFQPHTAAEVLANQYGDCKDKHTLLAALLEAAGLRAYPVLIHSARELDPELPSPAQFDHVISAVPAGEGFLWLDTTTEVAPFAVLAAPLRNKKALLVSRDRPSQVVDIPPDLPFPARQEVDVEGRITELGTLEARVRYRLRGDTELYLRLAFRRAPQAQWKQLGQMIAMFDGLGGEVTETKASDPAATEEPFTFEVALNRPNFLNWSSKSAQLDLPLPGIGLPDAPADDDAPLELGTPLETALRLRLELPPNYTARAPVPVVVKRDYGEYRSGYALDGHVLTAERYLRTGARELPAARLHDYLAFVRAIRADEGQKLAVETTAAGTPGVLHCSAVTRECTFVLFPTGMVRIEK